MDKKSVAMFLLILCGVFFVYIPVFALAIPGVTEPIDPPDFYSPINVSVPDSTYTPFTMTDLAANGYQVQDVRLNAKSIISDIKSLTEMINQMTRLANQVQNLAALSPEGILAHYTGVSSVLNSTIGVWQSYNGLLAADSNMQTAWKSAFQQVNVFTHGGTSVFANKQNQLNILQQTYSDSMNTARIVGNQQQEITLLKNALNQLNSTSGRLQNKQVEAQIDSVNAASGIKQNIILANLQSVVAALNQMRIVEEEQSRMDTQQGLSFGVTDPYQTNSYNSTVYTRPQGQGMISF